ncbi:hypothetical protein HYW94_01790 [Candidatus Uhrbacteria bacterium]|nr:hypothetical protein [Candidatus Uhrbacteria bacterium]
MNGFRKFFSTFLVASIFYVFLISSLPVFAQSVTLQIPIGETKSVTVCSGGLCHGIALYIVEFAKWLVGTISLAAVIAIMFGGIVLLTSRANQNQLAFAKKLISDSLIGLGITIGSYLLLSVISPDLINFKNLALDTIQTIGFELDVTAEQYAVPSGTSAGKVNLGAANSGDLVKYVPHTNLSTRATGQLRQSTAEVLRKAADICAKKGKKIIVGSDFRSFDGQVAAYKRYLAGGNLACNPGTDPKHVRCPHTSGQAVDLDTSAHCQGRKPDPVTAQCMKEAGFDCVLMNGGECWHYEYPSLSGACVDPAKYF